MRPGVVAETAERQEALTADGALVRHARTAGSLLLLLRVELLVILQNPAAGKSLAAALALVGVFRVTLAGQVGGQLCCSRAVLPASGALQQSLALAGLL